MPLLRRIALFVALSGSYVAITGCGTILNGSWQEVPVTSEPTGAEIWVGGVQIGQTPMTVFLRRRAEHRVTLRLEGHDDVDLYVGRNVDLWPQVPNYLCTGALGAIVDVASGGLFVLAPGALHADLAPTDAPPLAVPDPLGVRRGAGLPPFTTAPRR